MTWLTLVLHLYVCLGLLCKLCWFSLFLARTTSPPTSPAPAGGSSCQDEVSTLTFLPVRDDDKDAGVHQTSRHWVSLAEDAS